MVGEKQQTSAFVLAEILTFYLLTFPVPLYVQTLWCYTNAVIIII